MNVGDRVQARKRITENGKSGGLPTAVFPDPGYIHAEAGEPGVVEYIQDGCPTVRFARTGTATILDAGEVEPILSEEAVAAVKAFLTYSWKDIENDYHSLTNRERELCDQNVFAEIVNWID